VAALIRPLSVNPELFRLEMPVMVGFALVLIPLAWHGRVLGRMAGAILVLGYVGFTTVLVMQSLF